MSIPNPQIYTLRQVLVDGILSPWQFLGLSISFLPGTILRLIRHGSSLTLLSPSRFQDSWFGDFWAVVGPEVRKKAGAKVVPLLDGRTHSGKIFNEVVGPAVSGSVIEVGPGSGLWVSVFSDRTTALSELTGDEKDTGLRRRAPDARVTKVYGVEPNPDMHEQLHRRVRDAGLEDVYEVVPVGIEELSSSGRVQKGSVDCIVSVLCLCSIPDPEKNIRELYTYLKPGGRWYAYEHVRTQPWQGWFINLYQGTWLIFFSICKRRDVVLISCLNSFGKCVLASLHRRMPASEGHRQDVEGGRTLEPC
jgi:SAM-dependent methyltransferase